MKEWIWINNLTFDGTVFHGQVGNEPQLITSVDVGDNVEVNREEICDWMVVLNDGKLRGGYTIRMEVRRHDRRRTHQFSENVGSRTVIVYSNALIFAAQIKVVVRNTANRMGAIP